MWAGRLVPQAKSDRAIWSQIPLPDLRVEIAKCDREGDLEPGLGAALPHGESPVRLFEREARRVTANAGRLE